MNFFLFKIEFSILLFYFFYQFIFQRSINIDYKILLDFFCLFSMIIYYTILYNTWRRMHLILDIEVSPLTNEYY